MDMIRYARKHLTRAHEHTTHRHESHLKQTLKLQCFFFWFCFGVLSDVRVVTDLRGLMSTEAIYGLLGTTERRGVEVGVGWGGVGGLDPSSPTRPTGKTPTTTRTTHIKVENSPVQSNFTLQLAPSTVVGNKVTRTVSRDPSVENK